MACLLLNYYLLLLLLTKAKIKANQSDDDYLYKTEDETGILLLLSCHPAIQSISRLVLLPSPSSDWMLMQLLFSIVLAFTLSASSFGMVVVVVVQSVAHEMISDAMRWEGDVRSTKSSLPLLLPRLLWDDFLPRPFTRSLSFCLCV